MSGSPEFLSDQTAAEAQDHPVAQSVEWEDGPLSDLSLAGVGTLSEILGQEEAQRFVDEIKQTRLYLYDQALKRWGPPMAPFVRLGSSRL